MSDENLEEKGYATQPMSGLLRPASVDLVGTKATERYEVIERLGGGGFGDVFKALDLKVMSRPVVIKVLKDEVLKRRGAARDWFMIKFQQEIEALSKIHDPGIVGIFDADKLADGRPFLVMEFVDGSHLREFVKNAREEQGTEQGLRLQDVGEIVRQVGRALSAAHDRNIIHRDLKPENIMVRQTPSGDLQVKVIDFGVAKVRDSLVASSGATSGFMVGSWRYMAPEQLQRKKVEAACDIYALGVIAYELLTGHHPFPAKEPALLKDLQVAGVKVKPRDLNPDLPEAAQAVVLKALSYYPSERQKRARDFGDELGRVLMFEEELAPVIASAPTPAQGSTLRDADEAAPAETAGRKSIQRQLGPVSGLWLDLRWRWLLASIAIAVVATISLLAWRSFKTTRSASLEQLPSVPAVAGPQRSLTYWLTVQRKHDREPFPSIGEKIFDAGSKFWLNIQTTEPGALYVFSEGKDEKDITEWNTMFPTRANNNGDAWLSAESASAFRTKGYTFEDRRGTVKIWLVWAKQRVELLEGIAKASYDTRGVINESAALQSFIQQHSESRPEILPDKEKFRLTIKGRSDVLVDLRELEYQP
jgi:serine/threonine protein kinase